MDNTILESSANEKSSPIVKHSEALRVWHWVNGLLITALLVTVLVNSTILKARKSAPGIQAELQKGGDNISVKQVQTTIHALSDKVWDIHVYLGYFLAAFLLYRLVAEFFQPADRKFIKQIKHTWQLLRAPQVPKDKAWHAVFVKALYVVFYLLLVIMVTTGLCLAFDDQLNFPKAVQHLIKNVHGFCMYLVLGFVILHIAGVVLAELKDEKGIVSDMINGGSE